MQTFKIDSQVDSKFSSKGLVDSIGDIAVWQLFGIMVVFVASFWILVSLDSDKDEIALDAQVYLKLMAVASAGLYGVIGFLTDHRIRKAAFSFPAAWVLVIFALYFLSSLMCFTPATAVASSFSIICIYLMTVTAVFELGKELLVKVLFFGVSLFVVGSWAVYFLAPNIGVMEEPIPGGEFAIRMSGLAHPNTLGQHAAFCIILGIGLWVRYGQRGLFIPFFVGLAFAALVMCLSRASAIAVMGGLAVGFRQQLLGANPSRRLAGLALASIVGVLVLSTQVDLGTFIEEKMGAVSKSGDSDEITTATGRAEIWEKSIWLIEAKPALGYGPTTSKYLLEDYSMYTHNLLLNIGLSSGVFGLLAGIAMCLSRIRTMFHRSSFIADALVTFVLINGLFENVIFSNLCGVPTICWILGLGWFHFDNNEGS